METPRESPAEGQDDFSGIKSRILQQIASEVKASKKAATKPKGVIYAKASHLKSHYSKGGGNPIYGKGNFIKSRRTGTKKRK
jgi:hypothetical protein